MLILAIPALYNSASFLLFYPVIACSYDFFVFVMFPFFIWFLLFFVEKNLPNYSRHSGLNYFDHHHTLFSRSFVGWELKMLEHIFTDSKCWSNSTVIIPLVNMKIMNSFVTIYLWFLIFINFVDYLLKRIYQSRMFPFMFMILYFYVK